MKRLLALLLLSLAMPMASAETLLRTSVSGAQNKALVVAVVMSVEATGELSSIVIDRTSGNAEFDAAVLRTIMQASPQISAQRIPGLSYETALQRFTLPGW